MRKIILSLFAGVFAVTAANAATQDKKVAAKKVEKTETAVLAGGCFWGLEELIRHEKGVVGVEVGYTGGKSAGDAIYDNVHTGATGHAESVKIEFDPKQLSYEDLLLFFFRIHDPTTKDRQGNDVGTQYRSAIFYMDEKQKDTAERVIERVNKSGAWKKPVVTEVVQFTKWNKAEDYHQDYLQKNPGGYTCHFARNFKF
jgi:peptide-methionine (S)-S-oxide reductase